MADQSMQNLTFFSDFRTVCTLQQWLHEKLPSQHIMTTKVKDGVH